MKISNTFFYILTLLGLLMLNGCTHKVTIIGDNSMFVGDVVLLTIDNPKHDNYTWESDNPVVASAVDGEIVGLSPGQANIYLIKNGQIIATHTMTIHPSATLILEGEDAVLIDEAIQLVVHSDVLDDTFHWSSSDDTIATVTDGIITGIQIGFVDIEVRSANNGYASIRIDVIENRVPKIIEPINILDTYIIEDGPYLLEAIAHPHYASQDFYWEVAGTKATIDRETGIITFIEEGTVYVICRSRLTESIFKVIPLTAQHHEDLDVLHILFVGNSLTYVNDIPRMIQQMGRASSKAIYCDSITQGGQFIMDAYTTFYQTIISMLNSKDYDYIILQEQSSGSYTQFQRFQNGVVAFYQLANQYDIDIILYQTWPYKDGSAALNLQGMTQVEMLVAIVDAYQRMSIQYNMKVNPVGQVFYAFTQAFPEIDLYIDANHASLAGSYLASCVHYVSFFNETVVGNTHAIDLDSNLILLIQTFVSEYLLNNN